MGDCWFAPVPRCPAHGDGPMTYDPIMSWWVCHGWDGEGCPHRVTDEEREWAHAGVAEPGVEFTATLWPPGQDPAPWARPDADVAGDLRAAMRPAGASFTAPLVGCTLHGDPGCVRCYVLLGGIGG